MTDPLRVLALVGTDYHPFPRFVRAVDGWAADRPAAVRCFVQYGTAEPPTGIAGSAFLEHEDLVRRMDDADVIVCHGGPSTITEARRLHIRPIVMPRLERHGEQVDDHQLRFVRRLSGSGLVWMVDDEPNLVDVLDKVLSDPNLVKLSDVDESGNAEAVRRFGDLVSGLFSESAGRTRRARGWLFRR